MRRTAEPFFWSLFGAGGAIAALLYPVHIALLGIAVPLGWVDPPSPERLQALLDNPLVRIYLFAFVALPMFHWAHRFRYTLYDGLQLKHLHTPIAVLCYGTALLVTVVCGWMLLVL